MKEKTKENKERRIGKKKGVRRSTHNSTWGTFLVTKQVAMALFEAKAS